MSIMLELTDDQAIKIAHEIMAKLQKHTGSEAAPLGEGRLIDRVRAAVYKQSLHTHFYTDMIARETGLPKVKVSNPLTTLAKRGTLKMICKGTWERVK